MKARERMGLAYLMASAMAMASGFEPPPSPSFKTNVKLSMPKLSGLVHQGDIPKGCQLVKVELKSFKGDCEILVKADIVAGSNKSFNKKHEKLRKEIQMYLGATSLEKIKADGYCEITEPKADEQEVVHEGHQG